MKGALAFRNVTCARGGRILFEGLSFALGAGDAALVTGPNGVGKSSLIRVAAGLLKPAAGEIDGSAVRALMAEASALDPAPRLGAALRFWAALDPDSDDPAGRVERAMEATGLAPLAEVPVRLLSTGQRRRAALARVVPANGLDDASVRGLEAMVARHRAAGGVALVATHLPIDIPGAQPIPLIAEAA